MEERGKRTGDTARAIYLYCFALSDFMSEPPGVPGVDGQSPVTLRRHGRVVAVVSEVPRDDFTGPDAEARLADLQWLGPRVMHHEEVIEQVMQRSPVFPARFGTLFSTTDRLTQLVARHHEEIVAFADRMAGKEEWAVKAYLQRSKATQALAAEAMAGLEERLARSPGMRFLQQQRLQSQAAGRLKEWTAGARDRLRQELRCCATDITERAVTGAAPPDQGEMVLNLAVLVPRSEAERMLAAVEQLNGEWGPRGLTVQCTGPLPPYSFTPPLTTEGA